MQPPLEKNPRPHYSSLSTLPEPARFVAIGQITNAINLTLQSLLHTNVPQLTKPQCYFLVVFFNMPLIHWINMSFIYGLTPGKYLNSFLLVAPLMTVMAFAGTGITSLLELYTPASSYASPFDVVGIGNVEWMTLLFVGVTNFFVTKVLLAFSGGKVKGE